jgi:hypothetical protein
LCWLEEINQNWVVEIKKEIYEMYQELEIDEMKSKTWNLDQQKDFLKYIDLMIYVNKWRESFKKKCLKIVKKMLGQIKIKMKEV